MRYLSIASCLVPLVFVGLGIVAPGAAQIEPTPYATYTLYPTYTPYPTYTAWPAPLPTPTPGANALMYEDVCISTEDMTELQAQAYASTIVGLQVQNWHGYVYDARKTKVLVAIKSRGEADSWDSDIDLLGVPLAVASALNMNQPVVFSGTIKEVDIVGRDLCRPLVLEHVELFPDLSTSAPVPTLTPVVTNEPVPTITTTSTPTAIPFVYTPRPFTPLYPDGPLVPCPNMICDPDSGPCCMEGAPCCLESSSP